MVISSNGSPREDRRTIGRSNATAQRPTPSQNKNGATKKIVCSVEEQQERTAAVALSVQGLEDSTR